MINWQEESEEECRFSVRQSNKHKRKAKPCGNCGGVSQSVHFANGVRIGKCCDNCGVKVS